MFGRVRRWWGKMAAKLEAACCEERVVITPQTVEPDVVEGCTSVIVSCTPAERVVVLSRWCVACGGYIGREAQNPLVFEPCTCGN